MALDKFYRSVQNSRITIDDLVSEATIGFLIGLEKFRFDRYPGVWTICNQYIRNHMDDFIMDNLTPMRKMSSSSHSRRLYFMYGKALKNHGFQEPLTEDQKKIISTTLDLSYNQIEFMTNRRSMMTMQNIDDISNFASTSYTEDYDMKIECERLVKKIAEIKPDLNDREIAVLERRMLSDDRQTCAQLSKELDISVSRIYQIERTIKAMLLEKMTT
jgi:RNA polymerase sigma-32 factor